MTLSEEMHDRFADRLYEQGYKEIALLLPKMYAEFSPHEVRLRVEHLKRSYDAGNKPLAEAVKRMKAHVCIRNWLDRHSPLSPSGLPVNAVPSFPAQQAYRLAKKRDVPWSVAHLPVWEWNLVESMAYRPSYVFMLHTGDMWHLGKLRPAGTPMLDSKNRIRVFANFDHAEQAIDRLAQASFSRPPLAPITFGEARRRYDPETRRVSTTNLTETEK